MAELKHPLRRSLLRGALGRCPACGQGKLFRKYLKVKDACEVCEEDLARYPADDGPAYVTIVLMGHLLVAPLLLFPIVWESPPAYSLPIILVPLVTITLLVLPRVKGAWVGLMYALGVKDTHHRLHTADAAD